MSNGRSLTWSLKTNRQGFKRMYRKLETSYLRHLERTHARVFHNKWFGTFAETDFLQGTSLDEYAEGLLVGIIPEKRMEAFLANLARKASLTT